MQIFPRLFQDCFRDVERVLIIFLFEKIYISFITLSDLYLRLSIIYSKFGDWILPLLHEDKRAIINLLKFSWLYMLIIIELN